MVNESLFDDVLKKYQYMFDSPLRDYDFTASIERADPSGNGGHCDLRFPEGGGVSIGFGLVIPLDYMRPAFLAGSALSLGELIASMRVAKKVLPSFISSSCGRPSLFAALDTLAHHGLIAITPNRRADEFYLPDDQIASGPRWADTLVHGLHTTQALREHLHQYPLRAYFGSKHT